MPVMCGQAIIIQRGQYYCGSHDVTSISSNDRRNVTNIMITANVVMAMTAVLLLVTWQYIGADIINRIINDSGVTIWPCVAIDMAINQHWQRY